VIPYFVSDRNESLCEWFPVSINEIPVETRHTLFFDETISLEWGWVAWHQIMMESMLVLSSFLPMTPLTCTQAGLVIDFTSCPLLLEKMLIKCTSHTCRDSLGSPRPHEFGYCCTTSVVSNKLCNCYLYIFYVLILHFYPPWSSFSLSLRTWISSFQCSNGTSKARYLCDCMCEIKNLVLFRWNQVSLQKAVLRANTGLKMKCVNEGDCGQIELSWSRCPVRYISSMDQVLSWPCFWYLFHQQETWCSLLLLL